MNAPPDINLTLPPELLDELDKLPTAQRLEFIRQLQRQYDRKRRRMIHKLVSNRKEKVGGPLVGKATRQARNAALRAAGTEPEPHWSTSGVSRTGMSIGVKRAMRWHKRAA